MPVSRRSFLIGAGSIITAAFVKEALELAANTVSSAPASGRIGFTNIYYEPFEDHWRLHLGKPQLEIPEPPLLIDNLRFHGYILDTQAQIDDFCNETGWSDAELFAPMNEWDWETQWEHNCSPEAQAFAFLEKHDIFPSGRNGKREGELIFQSYPNPSSNLSLKINRAFLRGISSLERSIQCLDALFAWEHSLRGFKFDTVVTS
ncbi:MAG: hypothetical protein AB1649_04745 [Chloroflexota bacterium]